MFSGAKYSIELRQIAESRFTKVFDFDYDFYDPQFKCKFEEKFIDHYYFDEIGFETVGRFKHNLKARLNKKMPYWTQLYETELAAQDLDFLLNKDYKETFLRTIDTEDKLIGTNNVDTTGTSNIEERKTTTGELHDKLAGEDKLATNNKATVANTNTKNGNDLTERTPNLTEANKISEIQDGVASVGLEGGLLTRVDENKKTGNENTDVHYNTTVKDDGSSTDIKDETTTTKGSKDTTTSGSENNDIGKRDTGSSKGKNTEDKTGKLVEKTELIGKGNIGVTSSAELLEKWRNILINIDEIIIDDCRDLFMGIY